MGAFAIKLAAWSNIHPIITVAGSGRDYINSLLDLSKGDAVVDYRGLSLTELEKKIKEAVSTAAKSQDPLFPYILDAISTSDSANLCARLLSPVGGRLTHVRPYPSPLAFPIPTTATATMTAVGDVHGLLREKPGARQFGTVMLRAFAKGLETGDFSGHPYEVKKGGLSAVGEILETLKGGGYSAVKFLFRPGDD